MIDGFSPSDVAAWAHKAQMIDALMETEPFWRKRIEHAKAIVEAHNERWDAVFAARFKQDYLLSNRDMDAMRIDLCCDVLEGKPRSAHVLSNPHRLWDHTQHVKFAEPVAVRCGDHGWAAVIQAQEQLFGLERNQMHDDCTERDFDSQLLKLLARDAELMSQDIEQVNVVVGFDGAANFTHVLLRLIDHKDGVAKESELKGVALAVGMGDDHQPNLLKMFGHRLLATAINSYLSPNPPRTVPFRGRQLPVCLRTCLDHSASRSMNGVRSNASPHSLKLHPHLEIEAPPDATWPQVYSLIQQAMPWRDLSRTPALAHFAPKFPWRCPCCSYSVQTPEEQERNIDEMRAARSDKTKKGKDAWVKRVARFCDAHEQVMEFSVVILNVHPRDNVVDLLHGMDINIPQRLCKFGHEDASLLDASPDTRAAIQYFYSAIACERDLRPKTNVRRNGFMAQCGTMIL